MKQLVVAAVVLVAFFSFGPWFAGKVGPSLSDAITEWATQPDPCPTATAKPTRKAHHHRAHGAKRHPRAERHTHPHPTKPTRTCAPSAGPSGSKDG